MSLPLEAQILDLEMRLREVVRERDQAYEDRNRARAQRDEARAALRTVAERQREADTKAFSAWLREVHATGLPHETPKVLADAVDAGEVSAPLVTEGDK